MILHLTRVLSTIVIEYKILLAYCVVIIIIETQYLLLLFLIAGMTSLMSSPFSAMNPFCAAQSYAPLTAK